MWGWAGDPASEYHRDRADRYRLPLCFLSASSPSALPVCPPSVILMDHNSNVNVTPSRAAITKARLPGSLPTRGIHRVRGATQHACRRKTTQIMQPSLELSSSFSVRPRWPDPRPLTPRPRSTNWLMFASRPVPVPAALPCVHVSAYVCIVISKLDNGESPDKDETEKDGKYKQNRMVQPIHHSNKGRKGS